MCTVCPELQLILLGLLGHFGKLTRSDSKHEVQVSNEGSAEERKSILNENPADYDVNIDRKIISQYVLREKKEDQPIIKYVLREKKEDQPIIEYVLMEEKEDQPIIEYDDKLNFTSQENIVPNISSLTEVDAKFQRMPSVLAIELVFVLLNNLYTFMIRSYKNSIPLLKRNIIILISYYLVEIVNFILIYQV